MTHASLFSGIGGFDLAAEWAGWTNVFNCEIDTFCQTVLKYHFPDAIQYSDIRATDFSVWRGRIDVLTGGFPCQPYSLAGKRKGTDDDRHLWPEMLRAIREIRPRWVVGENVFGIVNWSGGLVFEQVCAELEAEGYEVQPYILPAAGVGAPHKRDRVWFVAHRADAGSENLQGQKDGVLSDSPSADTHNNGSHGTQDGQSVGTGNDSNPTRAYKTVQSEGCADTDAGVTADTDCDKRCERGLHEGKSENAKIHPRAHDSRIGWRAWQNFPTQSPVRTRDDEFPIPMDGITLSKWRQESIKGYGNAIVPQVVYRILETINEYERINSCN